MNQEETFPKTYPKPTPEGILVYFSVGVERFSEEEFE